MAPKFYPWQFVNLILALSNNPNFQNWIWKNSDLCYSLELGYLSTKSGLLTFMDECDLKLANHGEGGQPSKDYAFTMQAGNFIISHCDHIFQAFIFQVVKSTLFKWRPELLLPIT